MLDLLASATDLSAALGFATWDIDPIALKLGPLTFRYYGILFATGLMAGYGILRWQFRSEGEDPDAAVRLTYGLIAGIIIGARLGHVFFYEAERYLANPFEIIAFWKGGLASHGAALGMAVVLAIYIYGIRKIPFRILADRMALVIPLATSSIRIGNFFNSEIVGRVTDVPWAVIFPRYDLQPRHPSQLYEATFGLALFGVIYAIDHYYRKRERDRPLGLLISVFMIGYFSLRFSVEFVKEFQTLSDGTLTMGQYLSIPGIVIGLACLWATLWGPWRGQVARTYLEEDQRRRDKGTSAKPASRNGAKATAAAEDGAASSRTLARQQGRRKRR